MPSATVLVICLHSGQEVLLDGVRSAEPPTNSGSTLAKAAMALPEALRVGSEAPASSQLLMKAAAVSLQLAGSSPFMRRSNSAAISGKAAL